MQDYYFIVLLTALAPLSMSFKYFCHLQPAPLVARFRSSNMELFISCATNGTSTAFHVIQIFLPFTTSASSGMIQTLIHAIISWLFYQLCLLALVNLFKYFWHIHLAPVAAGFKPSNGGLLFDCSSNCTSSAFHVNQIFLPFTTSNSSSKIQTLSNMELLISCATNCTNTAAHVIQVFLPFTTSASSGMIQTLVHAIISWLFYQLCLLALAKLSKYFFPFSPGASSGRIQTL
jgi:hypothetical protein